jgi:predicted RNase H-like HicB family nuclease
MKFDVVIRKDQDGYFVASVPSLPGCHTQARSLEELEPRIEEAVALCLDAGGREAAGLDALRRERQGIA